MVTLRATISRRLRITLCLVKRMLLLLYSNELPPPGKQSIISNSTPPWIISAPTPAMPTCCVGSGFHRESINGLQLV